MKSKFFATQLSTKLFLNTLLALVLFAFYSCESEPNTSQDTLQKVLNPRDTVKLAYAENFEIIKFTNYTKIEVKTDDINWTYYLYKDEKPLIKGTNFSFIQLPIKRVIALSSTHLGMLDKLNLNSLLVGISSYNYVCSDRIKRLNIKNVGDIGSGNFETYLQQKPNLLMHAGFDMSAPVLQQLYKADMAVFANYDWKETHPLGRAEWIKVFGVLFDREAAATAYFNQEVLRYETLKDLAKQASEQPKIIAGSVWGDFWNAPGGDSYMAQLFKDANLDYLYKKQAGVGSLQLQFEALLADHGDTENWINAPGASLKEIKELNPKYAYLKAFKNQNVFSYAKNQNCFWEQSAISPHKILADFITLFHPDLVDDETLYFYNKLN